MMNLLPYFIAWAALAIVVLILALMRRQVTAHEDDTIHLGSTGAAMVTDQVQIAKKIEAIDKWGKVLTVVLAVSGVALGSIWALRVWEEASRTTFQP